MTRDAPGAVEAIAASGKDIRWLDLMPQMTQRQPSCRKNDQVTVWHRSRNRWARSAVDTTAMKTDHGDTVEKSSC